MDDAAQFWGTVVHVLASDHWRKAKAISASNLLALGWLGALVAYWIIQLVDGRLLRKLIHYADPRADSRGRGSSNRETVYGMTVR